jgi:hypothetical protein
LQAVLFLPLKWLLPSCLIVSWLCPHLPDPVTIAICLFSIDPIVLNTLRWTIAYAASICNNPDSLQLKYWYSVLQALLISRLSSKISKLWTCFRFQPDSLLTASLFLTFATRR